MTAQEFLGWAQSPGVVIIVGIIVSLVVEYFPTFYENLAPKAKQLVYWGFCMVVPLLAALISCLAQYKPWAFEQTWWPALTAGFSATGIGTVSHTVTKRRRR